MRLLACGDFHIGAGTDYGATPWSRLDDQAAVLTRIAEIAEEHTVDLVLFAGDAFERRRPSPDELLVLKRWLAKFEVSLFGIVGNHDVGGVGRAIALELYPDLNLYVSPGADYGASTGYPDIVLACLPWQPLSQLAPGVSDREEAERVAADALVATAEKLYQSLPDDTPRLLLAHWSVTGATTGTGAPTALFREPVLPLDALDEIGYDAIVLGHIHAPQVLRARGALDAEAYSDRPVFYVGSPIPLNFGEADSEHGVWILDIDDGVSATFVPIKSRRFVTLGLGDPINSDLEGAIVRFRYTATEEEAAKIDHAEHRKNALAAGAHSVWAIEPTITRAARARTEGLQSTDLDPLEALRMWAEREGVTERDVLTERATSYLEDLR